MEPGSLFAISDLHVSYPENRELVEGLRPASDADWLIVAGDVGEKVADVEWTLGRLRERYATTQTVGDQTVNTVNYAIVFQYSMWAAVTGAILLFALFHPRKAVVEPTFTEAEKDAPPAP